MRVDSFSQICRAFGEQKQQVEGWHEAEGDLPTPAPTSIQQTHQLSDLSPGSGSGAAHPLQGPEGLEAGDLFQLSGALVGPCVEWSRGGGSSQGACPSPPPTAYFPGSSLRFPRCEILS